MLKKESIHRDVNSYDMAKEVACAAQVEELIDTHGLKISGSFGLMLKLLRLPEINLLLNARLVECISMFKDEVEALLDARE